jgi:hypothetical protein
MSTSSIPEVSFHRTAEGFPAALVEDRPFVAMPNQKGAYSVWSAYSIDRPPAEWTRRDFYIASGTVADEEAFRAHVREIAEHRCELRSLSRPEIRPGSSTPWGSAQVSRRYADGIIEHSTAGHGGLELDAAANAKVPALYRNQDGFYEEDGEWSKVAATFPHLFTAYERKCADEALRNTEPDAYESVNGIVLQPGQSRAKDARRFQSDHGAEWVVISAISSSISPGFVECMAARGGDRAAAERRRFLVPSSEYEPEPFGFVIDETRHRPYDGPSDFAGIR